MEKLYTMKENLALIGSSSAETMAVAERIVQACEDVKGKDLVILDVASISDVADFFIVVSGRSDRQVQGITNRVMEQLARAGVRPLSVEGYEDGQWVLIDCGEVVVHVFYEPVREIYDLESLWMRARRLEMVRAA
jgi:ribosome-associated protein